MSSRTHTSTYSKALAWKKTRQTDRIWVNHGLTGLESHWKLCSRLRHFLSFWAWSLEIRLWRSPSQPSSHPFLTSMPSACPLHLLLHLTCILKDTDFTSCGITPSYAVTFCKVMIIFINETVRFIITMSMKRKLISKCFRSLKNSRLKEELFLSWQDFSSAYSLCIIVAHLELTRDLVLAKIKCFTEFC